MATLSNHFGAKGAEKGQSDYVCILCDFTCCKIYNWLRHISTNKHKQATIRNSSATEKGQKEPTSYFCENCGKNYYDRTGLWRHNKKCIKECIKESDCDKKNEIDKDELIKALIEQNAKLMTIIENGTNNYSNNITNSNNKAFNLNFFLNETCKNAMNISEFVDSIKLQLSDLMDIGELGYVDGISKIIVKNLNSLDETQRPIHCTDRKRETMYIKDGGEWNKEDERKTKLRKAINRIADKNIRLLPVFREKYPEYNNSSAKISDVHDKLVIEVMETDDEKKDKIIHNISKVTTIKGN
ncbi:MAG: hypothetical protein ACOVRN_00835 [Flavobacterium sp.]